MAAGYLFHDRCYASLQAATSAYWSVMPVAYQPGATSYMTEMSWSGSAWVLRKYAIDGTGTMGLVSTTSAPAVAFESCDTTQPFFDGLELGGGVAVAMILAYVIRIMGWGSR